MAYQSQIPQPPDRGYVSQGDMLANFQAINDYVQVNHFPFNVADQGKHLVIELLQQASAPNTIGTNIAALYNTPTVFQNSSDISTLGFRRQNDGEEIRFTETFSGVNTNKDFRNIVPPYLFAYWNRLPNGTLVKVFTSNLNVNPTNSSTASIQTARTDLGPAFTSVRFAAMVPQRIMTIDPNNTLNGDPNVVIYVTGTTATTISYIAFVRNLFNFGRQSPKQMVTVRTIMWGI